MQKALVAGNDKKIISKVLSSVMWGNVGYERPDTATIDKTAIQMLRKKDYDVLIFLADNFPWEKIYKTARSQLGKVDLILLCQNEDFSLAKTAFDCGASGLFTFSEIKEKNFPKLLDDI